MKITVSTYASTRGISEATAKKAIIDKGWELEQNPNDKRQRLLDLTQQAELDQAIPKAKPPSATPTVPIEVVPYDRPTDVGMTLAKRAVEIGEITYTPNTAIENPLFLALQNKVNSMEAQNRTITQQMQVSLIAQRDTEAAIDAYQQMDIIQQAAARAARDHQLDQQAYNHARQNLQMQSAGLSPVPAPPAAPTPPAAPSPTIQSKSPF